MLEDRVTGYRICFDSFESNKKKTLLGFSSSLRTNAILFSHRFIYRNRIHAVQETVTEILLLEDKAKYGTALKKIAFAKQMLAPSS